MSEWTPQSHSRPCRAVMGAVPIWGQCGGKNYTGDKICGKDLLCVKKDIWYSQCKPDPNAKGLGLWEQCGGEGYVVKDGRKDCLYGAKCVVVNKWYSQCRP
jgi:hypothetical protein